jgi:hypothetical protein
VIVDNQRQAGLFYSGGALVFSKSIQYLAPGHVCLLEGFVKQLAKSEHRARHF